MKHHEHSQSYFEANDYIFETEVPWLFTDLAMAIMTVISIILCIWSHQS